MTESRCGVCCSQCERKEKVHCSGCTAMKLPFWGTPCGVKSCCEEKGLAHCGQCSIFPCEMVASMGTEMGFDPRPRIEMLKKWAEDEKRRDAI